VFRKIACGAVCLLIAAAGCGERAENPNAGIITNPPEKARQLASEAQAKLVETLKASGVRVVAQSPGELAGNPGNAIGGRVAWVAQFMAPNPVMRTTATCIIPSEERDIFLHVTLLGQEQQILSKCKRGTWVIFTGILKAGRPGEEGSYEFEIASAVVAALVSPGDNPVRTDRWEVVQQVSE